MSSIIQTVSFQKEDASQLIEKLGELLGIHKLIVSIQEGETIEGIVSEVGKDYIILMEGNHDIIIPISKILVCRYER